MRMLVRPRPLWGISSGLGNFKQFGEESRLSSISEILYLRSQRGRRTMAQSFTAPPEKPDEMSDAVSPSEEKHTATLIFFHGLGDTGHGWAKSLTAMRLAYLKIVCPTAPVMPVTLNAGFRMPSWFDLRSMDPDSPEDEEGICKAAEMVHALIAEEVAAGTPSSRIFLGGFSQGGALALYSAFTYEEPLAGVIGLSCWLPLRKKFPAAIKGNSMTQILQCHGDCDPIVPYTWGQSTAYFLRRFSKEPIFKTYRGMMHTSCQLEIFDIKKFIVRRLSRYGE